MTALDYLHAAGLVVELNGEKLRLSPTERIKDADRLYVRNHRAALIAELHVANTPTDHWLPRVAQLVGLSPAELLEGGYLDAHDLIELAWANAEQIATGIRSSLAWFDSADTYTKRIH